MVASSLEYYSYFMCVLCTCYEVSPHTDVRDKDNRTPLHWACMGGSLKVVQYLVEDLKWDIGECIMFKLCIPITQTISN